MIQIPINRGGSNISMNLGERVCLMMVLMRYSHPNFEEVILASSTGGA